MVLYDRYQVAASDIVCLGKEKAKQACLVSDCLQSLLECHVHSTYTAWSDAGVLYM